MFDSGSRSSFMNNMEDNSKRSRPFFSSPEDLYDEDYYDEQLPEKKRRLTAEQVLVNFTLFDQSQKVSSLIFPSPLHIIPQYCVILSIKSKGMHIHILISNLNYFLILTISLASHKVFIKVIFLVS